MERLERVRAAVDEILRGQPQDEVRRCGCVHLYGVSAVCALLALRRGLDPALAALAGMLHDIATYRTGDSPDHGQRSAREAVALLTELGGYTAAEVAAVCAAIAHHSDKDATHGPLVELLKDADVVQHFLYNPALWSHDPQSGHGQRLARVLGELGIARDAPTSRS